MRKKYIILGVIIALNIIGILYIYLSLRTTSIAQNMHFKKVYNGSESINDINITAYSLTSQIAVISDKNDIENIIEIIKNEKIKPIPPDTANVGSAYRLEFKNIKKGKIVDVIISPRGVNINRTVYKTDVNLAESLKSIMDKYNINLI